MDVDYKPGIAQASCKLCLKVFSFQFFQDVHQKSSAVPQNIGTAEAALLALPGCTPQPSFPGLPLQKQGK